MARLSPCNPLSYLTKRQYDDRLFTNKQNELIRERLNFARNLYTKDINGHYGCVNGIEFSNKGEFLASGGDDRRVLIWNLEQAIHGVGQPTAMDAQHLSNIFCLGFDSTTSKVFSGGNDDQVIVHDTRRGTALYYILHDQPVYGISIDPLNDNIFASACDDGRILIYDIREPTSTEPFCLAQYNSAFHAVMFNPVEPRVVTTANSREGVGLWDVRKPKKIVMHFGGQNSFQSCMSVRFNSSGTKILALRRRLPPVIYEPHSSAHLCQFDHAGYYNSCTMKSCSFAGSDDQYVLSGSDNFNLYMWKVPSSEEQGQWIGSAHMVLEGHRSIVNQVRFDPTKGIVASSGVEKLIKLWSPFKMPHSTGSLYKTFEDRKDERKVYSHEEYINLVLRSGEFMSHDYTSRSTQEDPRMMAFFDSLVQREIEGWTSEDGSSEESIIEENPTIDLVADSFSQTPQEATFSYSRGSELQAIAAAYVEAFETISPETDVSNQEPNRISQLIARKRAQLMRLAQHRPFTEPGPNQISSSENLVLISPDQAGNSGTRQACKTVSTVTAPQNNAARKRSRVSNTSDSDSSENGWATSTKVQKFCWKYEIDSTTNSDSESEGKSVNSVKMHRTKKQQKVALKNYCFTSSSDGEDDTDGLSNKCSNVKKSSSSSTSDSSHSGDNKIKKKKFSKQSPMSCVPKKSSKRGRNLETITSLQSSTDFTQQSNDNIVVATIETTLADLQAESNESFIRHSESSSSDESYVEHYMSTPVIKNRHGSNSTPDSGIAMDPCSSSTKVSFTICATADQARKSLMFSFDNTPPSNDCERANGKGVASKGSQEPEKEDWQSFKRIKVQGDRRNYRKHINDSDSN